MSEPDKMYELLEHLRTAKWTKEEVVFAYLMAFLLVIAAIGFFQTAF